MSTGIRFRPLPRSSLRLSGVKSYNRELKVSSPNTISGGDTDSTQPGCTCADDYYTSVEDHKERCWYFAMVCNYSSWPWIQRGYDFAKVECSDDESTSWSTYTDEGTQMEPVAGSKVPCSACIAGHELLTEKCNTTRDHEDVSLPTGIQANNNRVQLLSECLASDDSNVELRSPPKQLLLVNKSRETI